MCILYRIPISFRISCSILIKIIDIEFIDSISRVLNRYRIIDIDIEAITSISKLQLGVPRGIHALVVGQRAYYISKNKHTISIIIRYRTMNIRYQRCIIDIEFVESISRGLNRFRIINIVLYYQYHIVDWYQYQSIPFLTASGVRSQGKLQRIQDPTAGLGAGFSKSKCGCGAMEGPFLVKSLWIKLWNSAKRGCRNPGLMALRLFGTGVMQPGQREIPLHSEWHWVNAISSTISTPIFYNMTFDIEREKGRWYRIQYQHTILNLLCSISKRWNIDIDNTIHDLRYRDLQYRIMIPSISNTFDIDIRHRRFKASISNGLSILKSSISNVALEIEGLTLDIGVARIQMNNPFKSMFCWAVVYVRYVSSICMS
jgi:hypothetical protein